MLIIPLLAVSFLAQVAVLAAPIPLNDTSLKARESLFNDEALFNHGKSVAPVTGGAAKPPVRRNIKTGTLAWVISRHFTLTLQCFDTYGIIWPSR